MRKALVAANWKMNGRQSSNHQLLDGLKIGLSELNAGVADVVICPPAVYLGDVREQVADSVIELGGQNASLEASDGAYTGECSAQMFADVGARWLLIGHSERRARYAEDDAVVAEKLKHALAADLIPILCIGETLAERDAGELESVIVRQVETALAGLTAQELERLVIAYEPVWAIGTGRTATPEQAQEVHALVRHVLTGLAGEAIAQAIRIVYGGSVTAANAGDLFAQPDIDGGLVGGASLKTEEFLAICRAATDMAAVG